MVRMTLRALAMLILNGNGIASLLPALKTLLALPILDISVNSLQAEGAAMGDLKCCTH